MLRRQLEWWAAQQGWEAAQSGTWLVNGWRVGVDPHDEPVVLAFRDGQLARFDDPSDLAQWLGAQAPARRRRFPIGIIAGVAAALVAAVIVFVLVTSGDDATTRDRLVGEWRGDAGTSLFFNADGSARLVQGTVVMDGPTVGGTMTWEVTEDGETITVEVVLGAGGQEQRLPVTLRFVTDDQIEVDLGEGLGSTTAEGERLLLNRV